MPTIGVQMMMLKAKVAEAGPYDTLRRLSDIGFRAVEISQIPMSPENVAQMDRTRGDLGIDFGSLSATLDAIGGANDSLTSDFDKVVADATRLGAGHIRIGMMPFWAMESLEALLEFCQLADKTALRLADEGIALSYHNHHYEFAKAGGQHLLDIISQEAPNLRLQIDVHWVQRGGRDPVRTLAKYAGRVDLVHLKDYRIGLPDASAFEALHQGDDATFRAALAEVVQFGEVGEGTLDWPEIIDQSVESGAQYLFIEQDQHYGRDPFDCLLTSYDNLIELGYRQMM